MAHIQVNVLWENGVFKYAVDPALPAATARFVTHVRRSDQITWSQWQSDKRVQVAFAESSPFVAADGTSWQGERATFPDRPAIVHPNLDTNRLGREIKYSVTLLDEPNTPTDDPEVIIVDGG
jgi:hypothetical protein